MSTATSNDSWTNYIREYLAHKAPRSTASDAPAAETERMGDVMTMAAVSPKINSAALVKANVGTTVANPTLVSAKTSQFAVANVALQPQYRIAALPYLVFNPAPSRDPVRSGDFMLWADPTSSTTTSPPIIKVPPTRILTQVSDAPMIAMKATALQSSVSSSVLSKGVILQPTIFLTPGRAVFAIATPRLVDLSVTIHSEMQPDRSIRITRGVATITVSTYAADPIATVDQNRSSWATSLSQAGFGVHAWKFEPLTLRNIQGSLELPASHLAKPVQISANTNSGTVTFIAELTEVGALTWKAALEAKNAASIPGICNATVSYYTQADNKAGVKSQTLSTSLGNLLARCGPDDMRIINPQQTVDAKLVIVGSSLVQSTTVTMTPNRGQAPAQQVFGSDGGQVQVSITTQDVDTVEVNWAAQVSYKGMSWPVIPMSGKLSSANGWVEMKNLASPELIANLTINTLLVDANGQPLRDADAGTNYHVNGVLTMTAPYLPGGALTTAFDSAHNSIVSVALPRFPGQPPGDVMLNMFATRDGFAGTKSRRLSSTELVVTVIVKPKGEIDIQTSADLAGDVPELQSDSMTMLAALHG